VTVKQNQVRGIYTMPLPIHSSGACVDTTLVVWDSLQTQTFTLSTTSVVDSVNLDPNGWIFKTPVSTIAVRLPPLPQKAVLSQNYPNPFNPSTKIQYELPKSSMVRLSVYDILGREVSVLMNERRNAGSYEVQFDAHNLASGVYFYRLTAGSFVETRKLLLVR